MRSVAPRPLFPVATPHRGTPDAPSSLPTVPVTAPLPIVPAVLDGLRAEATRLLSRARAPYSGRQDAVVLVLADGSAVPGVRVESASYPLTIGAVQNALTTAAALRPGVAPALLVATGAISDAARLHARATGLTVAVAPDVVAAVAVPEITLPLVYVPPGLGVRAPRDGAEGVELARQMGERAIVSESGFHVGCVVEAGGVLVPGCNVETAEWGQILCAERNALGTVVSYGLGAPRTVWLHCPGSGCSPCGACRQILTEQANGAAVWMPTPAGPVATTPAALLPGAFTGASLVR